jgi:hypothetical protein
MRTVAVPIVLFCAAQAHAIGLCEDVETRFDAPELFDEATRSFAIPASQGWCDELQDGGSLGEKRGTVPFVQLRGAHGVLGVLSTASGADADRLKAAAGTFEAVAFGKLHATLLKRGFAPLAGALKGCKITTAWTDVAAAGGWRSATLQLEVVRAGKPVLRKPLGQGSIARKGDQVVRAHVLADRSGIAVFAIVPSCEGPPPGYFGPDDGGQCYRVDTPVVLMIDAKSEPALAGCL